MEINLNSDLAAALHREAEREGVPPETLVVQVLQERFASQPGPVSPRDPWERSLLDAASDCGVSLSNEAVSSEGLYE